MATTDVASVRAEIKKWERDFRAEHGRDPSVQEIKGQPTIAAKYKLYKTLSKTASSGSAPKPSGSSTTPPSQRPQQSSSSIVPKSRAIKVDPPLSSSNPFSPVKKRKNLTDLPSPSQRASNQSRPNPFATPSKPKHTARVTRRSPSPDPFPPILPLPLVQRPPLSPAADSAVTRARKRLRGEPVSPSPVKEKRPRVVPQAAPSFAGRPPRSRSPEMSYADDAALDPNDTIIADTPMKPLKSGRSFKVLFDDAPPNNDARPAKILSRKTADSPPPSLRGMKRDRSRALTPSSDEDGDWDARPKLKSLEASAALSAKPSRPPKTRVVNGKLGVPKALVPARDDLWSDVKPSMSKPPPPLHRTQSDSSSRPSRPANKRALSKDFDDVIDDGTRDGSTLLDLPLIPPSPPPESSTSGKGKGKSAPFGRKKPKFLQGSGDAESEEEEVEIQVREVDPRAHSTAVEHGGDADSDWETQWRAHRNPGSEPAALLDEPSHEFGKFEVDLPEDLQRILAISPGGRTKDSGEKVVKSLLYGSRETHYDASKGGEIWDVGEESDHGEGTEDWEGEPVPWEVGEL